MIQFQLPNPHIIDVVVPRKKVNTYLSLLWEKLSEKFLSTALVLPKMRSGSRIFKRLQKIQDAYIKADQ